jgi:hypothetical protein
MMIGGMLLTGMGLIGTVTGAFTLYSATAFPCEPVCMPDGKCTPCAPRGETTGIVLLALGGVGLAAGIPLLIIGSRRDPVTPMTALFLGPGHLTLAGQF